MPNASKSPRDLPSRGKRLALEGRHFDLVIVRRRLGLAERGFDDPAVLPDAVFAQPKPLADDGELRRDPRNRVGVFTSQFALLVESLHWIPKLCTDRRG